MSSDDRRKSDDRKSDKFYKDKPKKKERIVHTEVFHSANDITEPQIAHELNKLVLESLSDQSHAIEQLELVASDKNCARLIVESKVLSKLFEYKPDGVRQITKFCSLLLKLGRKNVRKLLKTDLYQVFPRLFIRLGNEVNDCYDDHGLMLSKEEDRSSLLHAFSYLAEILYTSTTPKGGEKYLKQMIDEFENDFVFIITERFYMGEFHFIEYPLYLASSVFAVIGSIPNHTYFRDTKELEYLCAELIGIINESKKTEICHAGACVIEKLAALGKEYAEVLANKGALCPLVYFITEYRHNPNNLKEQSQLAIQQIVGYDDVPILLRDLINKSAKVRGITRKKLENRAILYQKQVPSKAKKLSDSQKKKALSRLDCSPNMGFQNLFQNFNPYTENSTTTKEYDSLDFIASLTLGNIDIGALECMGEYDILNFLPYICSIVREQSIRLENEPDLPSSQYYQEQWPHVLDKLIEIVEGNLSISQYLSYMEDADCGFLSHDDDELQGFGFKKVYESYAKRTTRTFWEANKIIFRRRDWRLGIVKKWKDGTKLEFDQKGQAIQHRLDPIDPSENVVVGINLVPGGIFRHKVKVCHTKFDEQLDEIYTTDLFYKFADIHDNPQDMRADLFAQVILHSFNAFWKNSPMLAVHRPFVNRYKTIPESKEVAFVEAIANCNEILTYDWSKNLEAHSPKMLFIRSAVGAYLSIYVLGLRDRTSRNIKVRGIHSEAFLMNFHYDKAFRGNDDKLESPEFPIPMALYEFLSKKDEHDRQYWKIFKELCAQAFLVLQSQALTIIKMAITLWKPIIKVNPHIDENKIRDTLKRTLMVEKPPSVARVHLMNMIENCVGEWEPYNIKVLKARGVIAPSTPRSNNDDESNSEDSVVVTDHQGGGSITEWTTGQLANWAFENDLDEFVDLVNNHNIDGGTLMSLSSEELRELLLNLTLRGRVFARKKLAELI